MDQTPSVAKSITRGQKSRPRRSFRPIRQSSVSSATLEGHLRTRKRLYPQVEALNDLLQHIELGGKPGEPHFTQYSRQMSYMINLLQHKTEEVASLRAGVQGPGSLDGEVDALQEAFAQETVGSWATIEEFRDTIMHFETEMGSAIASLQEEVAEMRLQVALAREGQAPAAARSFAPAAFSPSSAMMPLDDSWEQDSSLMAAALKAEHDIGNFLDVSVHML